MKVGFIAPYWLPHHGGGEQYVHETACALLEQNVNVVAFTSTVEDLEKDNGRFPSNRLTRWSPDGKNTYIKDWNNHYAWMDGKDSDTFGSIDDDEPQTHIMRDYDFIDAAVKWAEDEGITIAIINSPWTRVAFHHVQLLYTRLQALGIKVGGMHLDLALSVRNDLLHEYKYHQDWEKAAEIIQEAQLEVIDELGENRAYYDWDSPLFFKPDFVISCSEWSDRFIDPLQKVPHFVLHPLMRENYWEGLPQYPQGMEPVNITMINPQYHKGRSIMSNLITTNDEQWSFRVLAGGYGDSFKEFLPMVENSWAATNGALDAQKYVHDMREVYRNTDILLFPSRYEGYGMAAVEPMFCGTAVIASNYPAILEAVGSDITTLCPFFNDREDWDFAVDDVLTQLGYWQNKSLERAKELKERQMAELWQLNYFLGGL